MLLMILGLVVYCNRSNSYHLKELGKTLNIDKPFSYPLDVTNPEKSLGYVTRASSRIFERVIQWVIADRNIQAGHWYFIRVLWQHDGLTQRELADAAHVTESTAVSAIAGMEKRGLIRRERSPTDKRKILVYLTQEGKGLEADLMPLAQQINAVACKDLTDQELKAYFEVSAKITRNMTAYFKDEVFGKP